MATTQFARLLFAAWLVGSIASQSGAQERPVRISPPPRTPYRENVWGPQSSPSYVDVEPHHCSTEFEGAGRGLGYMYRGLGAGLRDLAEAQVHLAVARQFELENQRERLHQWYEKRDLYADHQAARHPPQASPDKVAWLARAQRPKPLSASELAADGTIYWPEVLCDARHDHTRVAIDAALRQLAGAGDPARCMELRQFVIAHCELLQAELQDRIRTVPCAAYLSGRTFLDRLRCDLAHPSPRAEIDSIAGR